MASFFATPVILGRGPSNRRRRSSDSDEDQSNLSLSGLDLNTQSMMGCIHDSEDDFEGEGPYDHLDPNETRRIVTDLIESCQELEEKQGFQENEDELIAEQVKQSKLLFEKQFGFMTRVSAVEDSTSRVKGGDDSQESMDSSPAVSPIKRGRVSMTPNQEATVVAEATASSLYLSFKHTKICAGLMRKKVQAMGASEAVFSVEAYLTSLKELGTDALGEYSSKNALEQVVSNTAFTIKTFPVFPCMLGSFDHREFVATSGHKQDVAVKVKTEKVKRSKFEKESKPAHEETNADQAGNKTKKDAGEETTNELRKGLIAFCKPKDGPGNLFEFAVNKDSIRETLNNTFGVAFGVRDGSIALSQIGGKSQKNNLSFTVSPCPVVPKGSDSDSNSQNRSQCILSLSAKTLKAMHQLAMGDTVIKPTT